MPPPPERPQQLSEAATIVVTDFHVTGATAFSEAELDVLTQPYEGHPISAEELQAARDAITRHYIAAGFVNSGATIPEQDAAAGVVEIRVVEGSLSQVEVEGLEYFRESYVRERLERAGGTPLSVVAIEERLQILQQDGRIRRVDADLLPGDRPGDARLRVKLEEEDPWWIRLQGDNYESPSSGAYAGRLDLGDDNVLGFGDRLFASGTWTEGLDSYSIGYEIPVNVYDTTLGVSYDWGKSNVVESPFDELDISSQSQTLRLILRQPLLRDLHHSLAFSLTGEKRESQTFLLGDGFAFAPGPNQDGESFETVSRASLDWQYRDLQQVVAARSQLSVGLDLFDSTSHRGDVPDGRFWAWLGQFQWLYRLDPSGVELLFRVDGQVAGDPLLSLEQFSVGGHGTVRGYRENQLVRDNGVVGSLEARLPLWSNDKGSRVQLAVFSDMGQSWNVNSRSLGCDPAVTMDCKLVPLGDHHPGQRKTISSVGAGLRFQLLRHVDGEVYYGYALRDVADPSEYDLQDSGIQFRLTVSY